MLFRWEKRSFLYADMAVCERENAKVNWAVVASGYVPSRGPHQHTCIRKCPRAKGKKGAFRSALYQC